MTVTLVAGPNRATTEQSLDSFLHCCLDRDRIDRFVVIDAGLSTEDRLALLERYRFLEFGAAPAGGASGSRLLETHRHVAGRYWLHLAEGWRFFAPEPFVTRLIGVLEAEPEIFQVGINFEDTATPTGRCPAESEVRRAADGRRYVVAAAMVHGPAMFDTARFDTHSGSRIGTEASSRTATLDEVLCMAAR